MSINPITHEVVVGTGPTSAFDIFATYLGRWWPLAYTFSEGGFADATVEPRAGGIWLERNEAGESLPWGEVRVYTHGERLVLAFAIGPNRKAVANEFASEVEVRFTAAGPGRARVQVEHRDFARHGDGAEALRAGMQSPQGWPMILAELRRWIRNRPVARYIVTSVDQALPFYTDQLGFVEEMRPAPGFAALAKGPVRLLLNEPGAGGAGAFMADGTALRLAGGIGAVRFSIDDKGAIVDVNSHEKSLLRTLRNPLRRAG